MFPEIPWEELNNVLDAVAVGALQAANVSDPPVDALLLAQRLGLTVAWDDRQAGRARMVNLPGDRGAEATTVLLRHDPRSERLHWAVAHEVGEVLAGRVFAQLSVDPRTGPSQCRENVANALASRLLLPTAEFLEKGRACVWDLFELKQHFATASHELIARRMLDFPPLVIVSVFDQNRPTWRKSNLPGRMPRPSQREIDCRDAAHGQRRTVYDDGPPVICAWPIHESNWQREIVRMEVDEFATG